MRTFMQAAALLTPSEKRRGGALLCVVSITALLDTAGIASIMPFLALLGNPELLADSERLNLVFQWSAVLGVKTIDDFLIFLGSTTFLFIVIASIYRCGAQFAMNRYVEKCRHRLCVSLLASYLSRPYEYFLTHHTSDMSKTILSEVDQVVGHVIRPAFSMLVHGFVVLFITGLLIFVDPLIALGVTLVFALMYTIIFSFLKAKLSVLGSRRAEANRGRFKTASEALSGFKELKVNGQEQIYISRFSESSDVFSSAAATHSSLSQIPGFLIEAVLFGALILLTIILLKVDGGLGGGTLGALLPLLGVYAFAAYRLKPAVQNIYQGVASLRYGIQAVNNVSEAILDGSEQNMEQKSRQDQPHITSAVNLEDIFYSYPGATGYGACGLNMHIEAGSINGLVGATGAGKSTIVDIILGLLTPQRGTISVDGEILSKNNLRQWQGRIGYVPQAIFLADASIAENIALGGNGSGINMDKVRSCARIAQIDDFVMEDLEFGYETEVGERGVRLSGGQLQRIGIARALYSDPDVLVFDEATSALDTSTERKVMRSIRLSAKKKTIILITHRLASAEACDNLFFIEAGAVKFQGTYSQMLENIPEIHSMAGDE